jgi:hypothetical protein
MRAFIRAGAMAMIAGLALGAPASAQERAPEAESSDIVVKGMRDQNRQVSKFVDALTAAPVGGQLSRFEEAACPAAIGLSPTQNKTVAARIRSVADAAGVPLGKPGCSPNVFVVVAQDKEAVIEALEKKYSNPLGDRVKAPKHSGPALAWHMEGRLDANGVPVGVAADTADGPGGYYVVEMGDGSSRIRPASRPHFLASVLAVEPDAVAGLTTTQLADYATMRLLARTDPSRLGKSAAPTILTILDAPMGSEVPVTLTHWDFAFLKALYRSGEGRYANQQRSEMRGLLRKELEKAQRGEKN